MKRTTLICIIGLGLSLPACDKAADSEPEAKSQASAVAPGGAEAEAAPEPDPIPDVDPAVQAAGKKLAGQRDGESFPKEALEKANARAFAWLAATQTDPDAIVAALGAMSRTWTPSDKDEERETVDDVYRAVVRKHLSAKDPRVLEAALSAATQSVRAETVDEKTLDALQSILESHDEPGARYLAVDTVGALKHNHPRLGALLLLGMADDQHDVVVSKSLDRVPFVTSGMTQRKEVMARAVALMSADNPGVRGNATKALGDLASDQEWTEARPKLEGMLGDEDAFVRAAALGGLGRLKDPAAIQSIMGLLGDETEGTYELTGWKTLRDRDGRMHHQGGAWFRVDRMALQALKDCTWRMGSEAFKHDKIDFKTRDADVAKAVGQAKAWYKKHRASLKTG